MNFKMLNSEQLSKLKVDYYAMTHEDSISWGEIANIDVLVSAEELEKAYGHIEFSEDDF